MSEQTTLRDEISANLDAVIGSSAGAGDDTGGVIAPAAPIGETPEQKAERVRDEQGRFAKQDEKASAPPLASAQKAAPTEPSSQAAPAAVAEPAIKKPSSWKKELDTDWPNLPRSVQTEIARREADFARGVSAYKQEAENARELNSALAPFMGEIQKHGIHPPTLIGNLLGAHTRLATGSAQDKVMMGAQLIQDYKIDPQALFQVLSGQVAFQRPQQQTAQPDLNALLEQKLTEREVKSEFNKFLSEVETKYPHYEQVKDAMAGLLQAGLAQDYASAYDVAIRLPQHSALYDAMQTQHRATEEAARQAAAKANVSRARSNAVSVRTSTPAGPVVTNSGSKSLHDELSAAFDAVQSGRV